MPASGYGGTGLPTWMAYKRQLEILPPISTASKTFRGYRIPKLPVPLEGETPPGLLCWGTVGNLPSPQQMPTVDFNVKKTEKKRVERPIRVENPDDPSQYIEVKRADQITFDTFEAKSSAGPNTSAPTPPGMAALDPAKQKLFRPAAPGEMPPKKTTETVEYKYTEPAP
jgi:hypothetical protein